MSDKDILTLIKAGDLVIKPFSRDVVRENGLDLRLGREYCRLLSTDKVLDPRRPGDPRDFYECSESEEILIGPREHFLLHTMEYIKLPEYVAGLVNLRSTWARTGIYIPACLMPHEQVSGSDGVPSPAMLTGSVNPENPLNERGPGGFGGSMHVEHYKGIMVHVRGALSEITVTPNHGFLVFDPKSTHERPFAEKPALSLRKGDLLAVARRLKVSRRGYGLLGPPEAFRGITSSPLGAGGSDGGLGGRRSGIRVLVGINGESIGLGDLLWLCERPGPSRGGWHYCNYILDSYSSGYLAGLLAASRVIMGEKALSIRVGLNGPGSGGLRGLRDRIALMLYGSSVKVLGGEGIIIRSRGWSSWVRYWFGDSLEKPEGARPSPRVVGLLDNLGVLGYMEGLYDSSGYSERWRDSIVVSESYLLVKHAQLLAQRLGLLGRIVHERDRFSLVVEDKLHRTRLRRLLRRSLRGLGAAYEARELDVIPLTEFQRRALGALKACGESPEAFSGRVHVSMIGALIRSIKGLEGRERRLFIRQLVSTARYYWDPFQGRTVINYRGPIVDWESPTRWNVTGMYVTHNTVVDAGFEGELTIEVIGSSFPVKLYAGERFLHLVLVKLGTPATSPYKGQYQRQKGVKLPKFFG